MNEHESRFRQLAAAKGWEVTKRGWPDFLCYLPDGSVAIVEVKRRLGPKYGEQMKILSVAQTRAMKALQALGVACFVSDGKTVEVFDVERHAPASRRRRTGLMPYAWRRRKKLEPTEV